jgi:hydrogenase-4 membrane subunit HyfE
MAATENQSNKSKHSLLNIAIMFLAINCIIVSVLTFSLTTVAVLMNNYDKWFPVAVLLSIGLFLIGRWLIRTQRHRIDKGSK